MAIIKKGILGTPKGRIGNIMGYSRLGKGVISSLPTCPDNKVRRWNLYNKQFEFWVNFTFNNRSIAVTNKWNTFNTTSLSPFEFYKEYCYNYLYNLGTMNTDALLADPVIDLENTQFKTTVNTTTNLFTLHLNDDWSFWNALGNVYIILVGYSINGTRIVQQIRYNGLREGDLTVNAASALNRNPYYLTYRQFSYSPVTTSNYWFTRILTENQ